MEIDVVVKFYIEIYCAEKISRKVTNEPKNVITYCSFGKIYFKLFRD